jgi:hypothetical protein
MIRQKPMISKPKHAISPPLNHGRQVGSISRQSYRYLTHFLCDKRFHKKLNF